VLLAAPSTDALITIKPPVSAGLAAAKRCSDGDGAAAVRGRLPCRQRRARLRRMLDPSPGESRCGVPIAFLRRNGFSGARIVASADDHDVDGP